jgi:hypothetical protein
MRCHERQVAVVVRFSFQHTLPASDWLNYSSSTARLYRYPTRTEENEAEAFRQRRPSKVNIYRRKETASRENYISSFHLCFVWELTTTGKGKIAGYAQPTTTTTTTTQLAHQASSR